jgi:hypothetical protein
MGAPVFLLQIVENDSQRKIAQIPGGGPLEADLIELCVTSIMARGVGVLRGEAHVEQDIRIGMQEALMSLKDQTRFLV